MRFLGSDSGPSAGGGGGGEGAGGFKEGFTARFILCHSQSKTRVDITDA